MAELEYGKIVGFLGNWTSGLGVLLIDHGSGVPQQIYCENGPTGRALIAAFDCAGEGHTIDNSKIKGEGIYYSVDTLGMLEYFIKEEDYSGDPVEEDTSEAW